MAMDPAVGDKAGQVQGRAPFLKRSCQFAYKRMPFKLAVLYRLRYPDKLLVDDPSGAHGKVADLGVPHLPFRQPHREARGVDGGSGILFR